MKRKLFLITLIVVFIAFTGCKKTGAGDGSGDIDNPTKDTQSHDTSSGDNEETGSEDEEDKNDSNEDETGDNDTDEDGDNQVVKSNLSPIIKEIYEIKEPEIALGDIPVDLAEEETVKYYTGLSNSSKIKDIAVSESMIGSQAYSLVLVQLNSMEDMEEVGQEMLAGIDKAKWICVEADDLQVVGQDDIIMLFMVSSQLEDTVTSQEIVDAFKEVRGGKLDLELK